jgi:hypothetical protein
MRAPRLKGNRFVLFLNEGKANGRFEAIASPKYPTGDRDPGFPGVAIPVLDKMTFISMSPTLLIVQQFFTIKLNPSAPRSKETGLRASPLVGAFRETPLPSLSPLRAKLSVSVKAPILGYVASPLL